MRHCPQCKTEVNTSAIVEVWPEPTGWTFYGPDETPPRRFIRCRGQYGGRGFIHFYVIEDGRQQHRLAYGIERETTPEPTPVQEPLL